MTKKAVKAEVNSFVKGLITEASPLNFPENASLDEQNFELLVTGARQRRLGLDFEDNHVGRLALTATEDIGVARTKSFVWEDAAGIYGKNIMVFQTNERLNFFDLNKQSISSDGFIAQLSFPPLEFGSKVASFTAVDGRLIVATGEPYVFSITYTPATNSVSYQKYVLKVRDMWGVATPFQDVTYYRPPTDAPLSHFYNLYNQSWGVPRRWEGAGEMQFTDPIGYFSSQYGVMPADEETVWTAMTTKAADNPYEYMRPNAWTELFGTTPTSAKGYFIIDLLRRGPSRTTATEENRSRFPQMYLATYAAPTDITNGGASVVHEFAGRVFYAGFGGEVIGGDSRSPVLSSYVAFSQLVNSFDDLAKCYQAGDPTSREGNDIVDTDGGLIRVSGVSNILAMEDIGTSLIVIGTNGVWAITGGSDYGFTATNYKVGKISDFGAVSPESVVKVGDTIMYWGMNSIYRIAVNATGDLEVQSISDATIQSFYVKISVEEKNNATGVYDDISKTVRWIYYSRPEIGLGSGARELILDTRIGAFYLYYIGNGPVTFLRGMFQIPAYRYQDGIDNVLVGTDSVSVSADNVVITSQTRIPTRSSIRYVVFLRDINLNQIFFTFSYYKNGQFRDWYSVENNGVDARAYLLTGALTAGDSSVDKQTPYITVHMYRTENGVDSEMVPINQSSCLLRSQWEWSNSTNSNKWSQPYQVYRYNRGYLVDNSGSTYDTGFELISTKNKLRGRGKSVSLYFETEPFKDCRIVGWNLNVNGNAIT